MILGRECIAALVKEKNLIESFDEKSLGGAGYDLRAGRLYAIKGQSHLGVSSRILPSAEEITTETVHLKPGDYILAETVEKVNMPKDLMARILPRSTLFRAGCILVTAVVDPGYYGTLTMGLKNLSDSGFTLEKGSRIGQIVFEEVSGGTTLYNGRYQGGKVV